MEDAEYVLRENTYRRLVGEAMDTREEDDAHVQAVQSMYDVFGGFKRVEFFTKSAESDPSPGIRKEKVGNLVSAQSDPLLPHVLMKTTSSFGTLRSWALMQGFFAQCASTLPRVEIT